jgi:hypothetical protein
MTVAKEKPTVWGENMKNLIRTLAVIASVSFMPSTMAAPASKDVVLGLSEVYIPGGFSSQTDAYVVVSGLFPNSCYHWSRADLTNKTPMIHEIKAIASVAQTMCLMVIIPYQKEVNLGKLASGDHTLRFLNGDGTYFEKQLTVE